MDFILKVDKALIFQGDKSLEYLMDWHFAVSDRDLALFGIEICEVLHVHIEETRAGGVDGLDDIGSGADGMSYIDTAADARVHAVNIFEDIEG